MPASRSPLLRQVEMATVIRTAAALPPRPTRRRRKPSPATKHPVQLRRLTTALRLVGGQLLLRGRVFFAVAVIIGQDTDRNSICLFTNIFARIARRTLKRLS